MRDSVGQKAGAAADAGHPPAVQHRLQAAGTPGLYPPVEERRITRPSQSLRRSRSGDVIRGNHLPAHYRGIPLPGDSHGLEQQVSNVLSVVPASEQVQGLEAECCVEALQDALCQGEPEVINAGQGSQFASMEFIRMPQERLGVRGDVPETHD